MVILRLKKLKINTLPHYFVEIILNFDHLLLNMLQGALVFWWLCTTGFFLKIILFKKLFTNLTSFLTYLSNYPSTSSCEWNRRFNMRFHWEIACWTCDFSTYATTVAKVEDFVRNRMLNLRFHRHDVVEG